MERQNKFFFSTTQIILLSFLITILIGSMLLALPISSASGYAVTYLDALFTATTATCVTGLVTLPTVAAWSTFGQVVILLLIQIGGLGVITTVSGAMILLNRKLGVGDRLLIQDAFNLSTMAGLLKFVRRVLLGTLVAEGIGIFLYMLVFVPEFGVRGVWVSVFLAVSAFCNAGMDVIAENSLCNYVTNPLINIVTLMLIILGGLGYIVWWDVLRVAKMKRMTARRAFRHLTLHSKIAVTMTLTLILGGALLILAFEYTNPLTVGNMSLFDKIQVALFQSVTTRTAGFASVPQENLSDAATVLCLVLMMIGGSPVGTAGGVKTVTIAVLLCSAFSTIGNREHVTVFNRCISNDLIRKAVAVVAAFAAVFLVSTLLLLATQDAPAMDILYEVMSAAATVGLSRNLTGSLNAFGKIVVAMTMYFGRVGPISLAVALGSKSVVQNVISNPMEDVCIG